MPTNDNPETKSFAERKKIFEQLNGKTNINTKNSQEREEQRLNKYVGGKTTNKISPKINEKKPSVAPKKPQQKESNTIKEKQSSVKKPEVVNAGKTGYQEIGPQQPEKLKESRLDFLKPKEYQNQGFTPDWDTNKTAINTVETTQRTSVAYEPVKTTPTKKFGKTADFLKEKSYETKQFKQDWDKNQTAINTVEKTQKTSVAYKPVKTNPGKLNPDLINVFQSSTVNDSNTSISTPNHKPQGQRGTSSPGVRL